MTSAGAESGTEASKLAEFEQLVTNAVNLQRSGQDEQALENARRAEALAPAAMGPTSLLLAHAHNFLGVVFFSAGYFRTALQSYERALAVVNRLDSGAEALLPSLNNNLGQVHHRLGQLEQAQAYLEAAVSMQQATPGETKTLGCFLDNLASLRSQRGDLRAAEKMHEQALIIFRGQGGPFDPDVATTLGNLANIYLGEGAFERAEAYRLRALDAHQRKSGLTSEGTLSDVFHLIRIYWKSGDEARADALVNHLLLLGGEKVSPAHRNLAEALWKLLEAAWHDFRLDVAKRVGTRVVELLEATEGSAAPETLKAVQQLASVHRALGDREAAERAYHRARSGYEARQMPDEAAAVAVELSKLYRDAGAYEVAKLVLGGALAHLRTKPDRNNQMIANALGNLALVHYEAERYEAADATIAEALTEIDQDPEKRSIDRPWLLHNRAMFKYHLGHYGSALKLYEEAKHLWTDEHGPYHPFVATSAANLALVHWAMGDHDHALSFFAEAEKLTDHEMQRVLAVGSEKQRAAYAQELLSDLNKVVSFCLATGPRGGPTARFAAQMLLRRKGRVLDAISHTLTRVRESSLPQDHVLVARLQAVREEMTTLMAPVLITRRPTDQGQRLRQLRDEEERLEASLGDRGALYRPGLDAVTLEQVQERLEPIGALVDLLRYAQFDPTRTGKKGPWKDARYAAMVLSPSGDPQWFDLGLASPIEVGVDRWRRLLRNNLSDVEALHAVGAELYRLLLEPLGKAIGKARHLLVSPDGKLVLIPFGAMRVPEGRLLQERLVVSYLSSGRELVQPDDLKPQARGIVVIAAPDFDFDADDPGSADAAQLNEDGEFEPLQETEEEANEVFRLFEDVTLVTGRDATAQRVRRVNQPIVFHVATHGIFTEIKVEETSRRSDVLSLGGTAAIIESASRSAIANPMYGSGLALAGANHRGCGALTAQEIAGLDLRGTALAVLSACDTGLGAVKSGGEFAGLRRALAIAGAQTQVTSLWRVDDASTRQLMTEYYQLLSKGNGRADALQLAQARLVEAHPDRHHPAYWAAFISAGAYGPISDRLRRRDGAPAPSAATP